jgi:Na+/H+ antiporter NhaD/arsenite permease-like protein
MMTPIGNPQNLFLYDEFHMTAAGFVRTMLPIGGISLVLLMAVSFILPKTECAAPESETVSVSKMKAAVYGVLFALCLCSVLRLVPDYVCLIAAVAAALICDVKLLGKVDYALLATFVCFFVFVGNLARIGTVSDFFCDILSGREIVVAAALSQLISNVPAAVMLAGFTDNGKELLIGVNIGGLGTLVASLASLISFQIYRKSEGAQPLRYLAVFTLTSIAFLAVLLPAAILM